MATVTKPIALDESLNTTELSSRNVADVLAQELQAVAGAIGGIAVPSADHVSYDNSVSGLSATDVQNAIDEVCGDIPTVNDGTLNIQQNGTSKGSFTANSASNVNVNIETPTADKKTATDQFTTADGGLLSKCQINLVPVQSGSGDPYPAGGGKNKLPSANSQTITQSGLTVKCDGSGLYTISAPSALASVTDITLDLSEEVTLLSSGYLCVFNSAVSTSADVAIQFLSSGGTNVGAQIGFTTTPNRIVSLSGVSLASETVAKIKITVKAGVSGTYTASPMVADANNYPFAPYSNIRPISGHTEVDLYNVGKNRLPLSLATIKSLNTSGTWSGNTYTVYGVAYSIKTDNNGKILSIKATGTPTNNADLVVTQTAVGSGSYILNGCPSGGNTSTYRIYANWNYSGSNHVFQDVGSGVACNWNYTGGVNTFSVMIRIASGTTIPTGGLLFKPMIRLSTDTDSTFEPYLGHLYQVQIGSTVYGGYVDLVSGVMTATFGYAEFDGDEAWQAGTSVGTNYRMACNKSDIAQTGQVNAISNELEYLNSYSQDSTHYYMYNGKLYVFLPVSNETNFKAWLASNPLQVCYPLATPQTIQLTPQQIETLVGQNNLSTPLDGQSIEMNGVEYKELFTWDDVQSLINNDYASSNTTYSSSFIETKFALKYDLPIISSKVVKASGSTSVTFSHERIFSADQTYCELLQYGSGDRVVVSDVSVTTGSVTFTFASATTQSITFRCRISNVLIG